MNKLETKIIAKTLFQRDKHIKSKLLSQKPTILWIGFGKSIFFFLIAANSKRKQQRDFILWNLLTINLFNSGSDFLASFNNRIKWTELK